MLFKRSISANRCTIKIENLDEATIITIVG